MNLLFVLSAIASIAAFFVALLFGRKHIKALFFSILRKYKQTRVVFIEDYIESIEAIRKVLLKPCNSVLFLRSFSPSQQENQEIEQLFRDAVNSPRPPRQIHRNLYLNLDRPLEEILNSNEFQHIESLIIILGNIDRAEVRYFPTVSFIIDMCIIDNKTIFIGMSEEGEQIRGSIVLKEGNTINLFRNTYRKLWRESKRIFEGDPSRTPRELAEIRDNFEKQIRQLKETPRNT